MRKTTFVIIGLTLTYAFYVYPVTVLLHLIFNFKIFQKHFLLVTIILSISLLWCLRTQKYQPLIRQVVYHTMGVGFIAFFIMNLTLAVSYLEPDLKFYAGMIGAISIFFACVFSLKNGRDVKVKKLIFESKKIDRQLNFAFISDVHLGSNPRSHLEKICNEVMLLNVDYLLIGGDLFDTSSFQACDLRPFLKLECPIYFVTGNHEYYVDSYKEKLEHLQRYNISILDNEVVSFSSINLIGVSDNQSIEKQIQITNDFVTAGMFNLVLVHKPSIWEKVSQNVDLMLSGHTHKGQIFPFNIFVRAKFKNVYGLFEDGGNRLYVSSGSGTWGPRMRLGTQNEILHISIQPIRMISPIKSNVAFN